MRKSSSVPEVLLHVKHKQSWIMKASYLMAEWATMQTRRLNDTPEDINIDVNILLQN